MKSLNCLLESIQSGVVDPTEFLYAESESFFETGEVGDKGREWALLIFGNEKWQSLSKIYSAIETHFKNEVKNGKYN